MLQVQLTCLLPAFELEAWWMWGYLTASPVLAAFLLCLCLISRRPHCCGVCGHVNHAPSLHWLFEPWSRAERLLGGVWWNQELV